MKTEFTHIISAILCCIFLVGLTITTCCVYYLRRYDGHFGKSLIVPAGHHFEGKSKNSIKFAVIGDINPELKNLDVALDEITKIQPDFVMSVGDMAKKPRDIRHMNWITERISLKLKNIPYFPTPGNWDHDEDILLENGLKAYMASFGNPVYFCSVNKTLLVSLDTSSEKLSKSSLNFLSTSLRLYRQNFKNCIVFTHVPPIDAPNVKHTDCLPLEQAEKLQEICEEFNVTLIICGHQHIFTEMNFGKIPLLITPSLGQESRSKNKENGYLIVSINDTGKYDVKFNAISQQRKIRWEYLLTSKLNLSPILISCNLGMMCIAFFFIYWRVK